MQQLSIFATPQPTPAPAKILQFRQPVAPKIEKITGPEYVENLYKLSEPIAPGDSVMLRDGTVGTVEKFAYNDKELPTGVKPCNQEGLREIVVTTAAGERCVYAYQLQKVAAPDPITNDAPKPLALPAGKVLTPITKEESNNTGKILTFTITTDRAELLQVADPLLTGQKTCSRRLPAIWTPQTTAWYQRAFEEKSNIQAWSAMPLCKKKNPRKLADLRLTTPLYLEALKDMPEEDLEAEGGLWATKEEFVETVCKGKPDLSLKFWVLRFELVNICV